MKRTLKSFYQTLLLSTLVAVLVLAVVLTAIRIVTPVLAERREAVEQWASALLGQPVQIKTVAIRWHRFAPVLVGKQVIIFNDARTLPLLKVNELDISIDVLGSLLSGHLQLGYLRVIGANLTVQQTAEGDIKVNGINNLLPTTLMPHAVPELDEFLGWLFSESRIVLENINLTWHDKNGKVLPITHLNLTFKKSDDHHLLAGNATLAQKIPSVVEFVIDLKGNWSEREQINAKIYVNAQDVVLTQWLQNFAWHDYKVMQGIAHFQIWADWSSNQLQRVQSLLTVNDLVLNTTDPKNNIRLQPFASHVYWEAQANNNWTLDANFKDFGMNRWHSVPGITGLTGYIHVTPTQGSLDLVSQEVIADFGPLFKAPLPLDKLSGHFVWEHDAGDWIVQGTHVNVSNEDAAVLTDFSLLLPADNSGAVINLLGSVEAYSAKHLANYLPLTIMQPGLVRWLSHAITHADNAKGTLILQGRLDDFPFANYTGTFITDADVKNVDFNYWDGWPPLKKVNGELIFSGPRMEINLHDGQILQTPLQNIQAVIPVLQTNVQAVLNLNASVTSDLTQGQEFLQTSPLRTKVGALEGIALRGPMQLQLGLVLPLEKGSTALKIRGHVATQNAELNMVEHNLHLSDLQGVLDFTQDNITAPALTARLWDEPITIKITAQPQLQLQVTYRDTPVTFFKNAQGWLLQIRNAYVDGKVLIPRHKTQPLHAVFNRINIKADSKQQLVNWKTSQIPAVNFFAQEVHYGDKNFGQVDFELRPVARGIVINNLRAGPTTGRITANGFWRDNRTDFNGVITSQNIFALLQSWSLPPGIAGTGKVEFKLNWPAAPYNPSLKQLNGSVIVMLKRGQIIDIGQSAAAQVSFGRLLTGLSLQSLGRHFTSAPTVTSKGFEFDEMKGSFTLKNGHAYTTDLFLDGPVAQINLSGRVGLVARDYDLRLKVTPHVTSSLPVIAGIAGGPILGVATWLANAAFGSTVQQIAASKYHITGSWGAPVVQPTQ